MSYAFFPIYNLFIFAKYKTVFAKSKKKLYVYTLHIYLAFLIMYDIAATR